MSFRTHVVCRSLTAAIALGVVVFVPITSSVCRAQDASTKAPVEPVDYKKLKELLPATLGGLKRADAEGSKQSVGDIKLSQVRGTYNEDGKDGSGSVSIMDYGAMPGMAEGLSPWMNVEVDNESDTEYTKTVKVGDYKGMETYNKESKSGSLTLVVGKRFLLQVEINDLGPEVLQDTVKAMKLAELEALAK